MNVIEREELEQAIHVGHSFGGMVASGAADALPEQIRQLVYLDGAIPEPGHAFSRQVPTQIQAKRLAAAQRSG